MEVDHVPHAAASGSVRVGPRAKKIELPARGEEETNKSQCCCTFWPGADTSCGRSHDVLQAGYGTECKTQGRNSDAQAAYPPAEHIGRSQILHYALGCT